MKLRPVFRCFSVEDPEEIEDILNKPWDWFDEIGPETDCNINVAGYDGCRLIVRAVIKEPELEPLHAKR
ncbi:hypothetical protein Metev_0656 [Methanohalobium evestigatum Z-7303]|uniref:Uncharacterized protein n=1 Tax=Methanohalobium evestigatum (strain ATCC BAA-1072 / DSM 3721 / NBRC 107634 / OCM 161 / Z-7303) TaxID=644295 RepID=D7E6T8_METEZ|nr:hypothetical protein [Methanohalobium evestigatum]ADI73562.1 hypothetical protein Metev_0656 [Methanohalobium evestigatum Z-7303]